MPARLFQLTPWEQQRKLTRLIDKLIIAAITCAARKNNCRSFGARASNYIPHHPLATDAVLAGFPQASFGSSARTRRAVTTDEGAGGEKSFGYKLRAKARLTMTRTCKG